MVANVAIIRQVAKYMRYIRINSHNGCFIRRLAKTRLCTMGNISTLSTLYFRQADKGHRRKPFFHKALSYLTSAHVCLDSLLHFPPQKQMK